MFRDGIYDKLKSPHDQRLDKPLFQNMASPGSVILTMIELLTPMQQMPIVVFLLFYPVKVFHKFSVRRKVITTHSFDEILLLFVHLRQHVSAAIKLRPQVSFSPVAMTVALAELGHACK